MEHFVTLPSLPEGLHFPADLAEKVYHDAARRRLVHVGFMSKAEFDRLSRLSDDWSYRRALEDLFRLCMPERGRRPVLRRFLSALGL